MALRTSSAVVAVLGTNAVAALAATFTLRLTLTVVAVVCGVGFAAYVTGTMAVLERTSEGTAVDGSRSELSSPTDG